MSQSAIDEFRKKHPQYSADKVSDEELAQLIIKKWPIYEKTLGDIARRAPKSPPRDLLDETPTPPADAPGAAPLQPEATPVSPGAKSPASGVPGEVSPADQEQALINQAVQGPIDMTTGGPAPPGPGLGGPTTPSPGTAPGVPAIPPATPSPLPMPGPGVNPAPGVLDAPRDVQVDDQGRVMTDPFTKNATTTAALKTAAAMALPMAGQAVGGVVGGAVGTMVSPGLGTTAGALGGQSVGAMTGEAAAQALGLSPENRPQIVAAGAMPLTGPVLQAARKVPGVGRIISNVASTVKGRLPGGYEKAEQLAAAKLRELPATLEPPAPSKPIYKQFDDLLRLRADHISTANTQKTVKDLYRGLPPDPTDPKIQRILKIMDTLETTAMRPKGKDVFASMKTLRQQMRDLKSLLKEPEAEAIYGAITRDLEAAAATSPAAKLLLQASSSFKAERVARRFTAIVNGAITGEVKGMTRTNADKILRALDNDPQITKWLSQAEIDRLKAEVRRRGKLPGPPIKFGGPVVAGGLIGGLKGVALGAGLPVLGAIGKHTLEEIRDVALNPQATQIAALILQGARAGYMSEGEEPIYTEEEAAVTP